MELGTPTFHTDEVSIPVTLGMYPTRPRDSAICVRRVTASVRARRILVRLDKCLCGPGATQELVARFPKPAPGGYRVVYEDPGAVFPEIGELEIR